MFRLLFPILIVGSHGMVMDNLKVAYQWKMLNFGFPSFGAEQEAISARRYMPEYNVPTGLEVYGDRLFLAIPRLKPGVVATLVYLNISEASMESPALHPYPNWEAHNLHKDDPPEIVSTFRIRADRCGRLWVLDSGVIDSFTPSKKQIVKPRLLLYDLNTDKLMRNYTIPDNQALDQADGFVNIAVEDVECEDTFAYLANIYTSSLVVYSYKTQKSWLVKHHYFNLSPLAGNMTVGGKKFVSSEGIFGLALSRPDSQGFSTLYFHPSTSFDEFAVSTKVLRDEELATNSSNFHEFKRLGTRGEKGQSGASFLDKNSNVIFFASIHLNAVICWRVTNTNYTTASHSRVFWNNDTMVYPSDIKVDANNTLWVLSNKLPLFQHEHLDYSEYNFRILKGKVAEAIKYTACDSKMVVNKTIVEKIKNVFNKDKDKASSGASHASAFILSLFVVTIVLSR